MQAVKLAIDVVGSDAVDGRPGGSDGAGVGTLIQGARRLHEMLWAMSQTQRERYVSERAHRDSLVSGVCTL